MISFSITFPDKQANLLASFFPRFLPQWNGRVTEMSRGRIAVHRLRYAYAASSSITASSSAVTRFQFQCPQQYLTRASLPFHFHSRYSSSVPKQALHGGVENYPSGDFDFKPLAGWKKFIVKLKMLTALPWHRLRYGTVLTIKLRGQVSLSHPRFSLITSHSRYCYVITTFSVRVVLHFRYRISSRVGSLGDYLCLKSVIISWRQLMILEFPVSISTLIF